MFDKQKKVFCCKCNKDVTILHIKCADCNNVDLCLQCFTSGVEFHGHLKTHRYIIIDNGTFPLFDNNWTAEEEHILIDNVEQFGLGNWDEVAFNIPSKTAKEVEEHYMTTYVDGHLGSLTVPVDVPNKITDHAPSIHDTVFSIQFTQAINKQQQHELAYMPHRDDYEYEFDNDAEAVLSSLFMSPDDSDLDRGLKLAQVGVYHAKLMERQRRKDIVREYNLLEKFFRKDSKNLLQTKYEKEIRLKLRCCSQFMKIEQFEKLVKGLLKEKKLKRKIAKLKLYRKNGITKFEECNLFDAALYKREKKSNQENKDAGTSHDKPTKTDTQSRLIDVKCQAEYNLLGSGEKHLCLSLKMTPAKYLTAKVLIVKDAAMKQHTGQTKARYSAVIEKSQRRRISSYLKENGWLT